MRDPCKSCSYNGSDDCTLDKCILGEKCGTCKSVMDVKAVQYKREMSVKDYLPLKEYRCAECRKRDRGDWRYWR